MYIHLYTCCGPRASLVFSTGSWGHDWLPLWHLSTSAAVHAGHSNAPNAMLLGAEANQSRAFRILETMDCMETMDCICRTSALTCCWFCSFIVKITLWSFMGSQDPRLQGYDECMDLRLRFYPDISWFVHCTWKYQKTKHVHLLTYRFTIWRFPKQGVPPNHPFTDGFPFINHPAMEVPPWRAGEPLYLWSKTLKFKPMDNNNLYHITGNLHLFTLWETFTRNIWQITTFHGWINYFYWLFSIANCERSPEGTIWISFTMLYPIYGKPHIFPLSMSIIYIYI